MSTFGAAFDKLPHEIQRDICARLNIRRKLYLAALKCTNEYTTGIKVVIIGDTPGPGRPNDPNFHHTPFYSTKNSSLWLNRQLTEAGIPEKSLLWFNAVHANGDELDPFCIRPFAAEGAKIVVLGGNAEKWFKSNFHGHSYTKVYHPQFAKRFRSTEPYALIEHLKQIG